MSVQSRRQRDAESALNNLSLASPPAKPKRAPTQEVADSWEAEAESDSDAEHPTPHMADFPSAPPPTPMSPSSSTARSQSSGFGVLGFDNPYSPASPSPRGFGSGSSTRDRFPTDKRPEKQVGVAGRLIAGALGVRAPPKTEEMRAYERTVKEKEKKRLDRERDERKRDEEERERKIKDAWDS